MRPTRRALGLAVLLLLWTAAPAAAGPPDALAAAYLALGGPAALGPITGPAFRRDDGRWYLLAPRAALVAREDGASAEVADAMAWFTAAGRDGWLEAAEGVPPPAAGTPEERSAWLTDAPIAAAYARDGARRWGLPASWPRRAGPFVAQRFDKGVLQHWVEAVPGAPPRGMVTAVLVGDLLAEAGLAPAPLPVAALPAAVAPGQVVTAAARPDAVAVTFDLGSIDAGLPGVLDALAARGLRATFFVTGDFVRIFPWVLPALVAHGHEIGNHSVTHPDLTTVGDARIAAEVDGLDAVLRGAGIRPAPWFRPPFGAHDRRLRAIVAERGQGVAMWELDLADWRDATTPRDIVRVARRLAPGEIAIGHGGLPKTAEALPQLLDELAARGLRQITLTELFTAPGRLTPTPAGTASASTAVEHWEAAFERAHGRKPTADDRVDRAWSLEFVGKNGRPPTQAEWEARHRAARPA